MTSEPARLSSGAAPSRVRRSLPSLRAGRLVLLALTVALVSIEAWVMGPSFARAARSLGHTDPRWLSVALVGELGSLVAFARLQRRMLAAGGLHVPLHRMIGLTYAANAINATLPAGSALSSGYTFRRLRKLGASTPLAGFTLIASGILSTAAFALLALTSGLAIGADRTNRAALVAELLAAGGAVYVARRVAANPRFTVGSATWLLGWCDRALRRPTGRSESAVHEFLHGLGQIKPRRRDWAAGLALSTANWVTDLACLAASCRALGIHASLLLVTGAFLAGATLSSLSLLPGGMGVVDAAMIAAFTGGGLHIASAAAAVVLYRLISFVLVVSLGWLAWAFNWRRERTLTGGLPARRSAGTGLDPAVEAGGSRGQTQLPDASGFRRRHLQRRRTPAQRKLCSARRTTAAPAGLVHRPDRLSFSPARDPHSRPPMRLHSQVRSTAPRHGYTPTPP